MDAIAIIPARGGSKRILKKNIKLFFGRPIISYAIETALASKLFREVIVSTDDPLVAIEAIKYGATCSSLRSPELSQDHVTTVRVVQNAILSLDSSYSDIKNICCIYPATPLLDPNTLLEGLKVLEEGDWEYVFGAIKFQQMPFRNFELLESGQVSMFFPQYQSTRSQDLPSSFQDAGQFYWGSRSAWETGKPIFTSRSTIIELSNLDAVDIDIPSDWQRAEELYKVKRRNFSDG